MKKLLFLLLLFAGSAYAQDVSIPDADFKAALLASNTTSGVAMDASFQPIVVDTNTDGEIQESEALLVYAIDMQNYVTVSSLEGLTAFTNLVYLRCINSNLSAIDLSGNTNLTYLALTANHLASIDISMLVNLGTLIISENDLTSLNVLPLVNLTSINCQKNELTSIDLSTLVNLLEVNFKENLLTSIDFTNNTQLYNVVLQNNQLAAIDVSMLADLTFLYISNNQLTALDVSGLTGLQTLDAAFNNLTTLDCSTNINLVFVSCLNNPPLETLFLKNGQTENGINNQYTFTGCPNLYYICADDAQVPVIQQELNDAGITTITVNSYCSFVPGGNYNTIAGNIHFDGNANGCDAADPVPANLSLHLDDGTVDGYSAVNAGGGYSFYTGTGNFTLTPQLENPAYFTVSPASATTDFALVNGSTFTQDFCVTPNGYHPDLEIAIVPLGLPRPGFANNYKIVYKNIGTENYPGTVSLSFDHTLMEFLDATVTPAGSSDGFVFFAFDPLPPFGVGEIGITFGINAPTDTPPVNNGDLLSVIASVTPSPSVDVDPTNNSFTLGQEVVGSFDPNNKICLEGEYASPSDIGKYLHYNINFENTGTADAENIVIKDVIDSTKFDISTLQVIESSHAVRVHVVDDSVEFIFEGINLSPSTGRSVIGGHGNVLFKIKTWDTIELGTMVTNTANIYFDYNFPIETNEARTTFNILKTVDFKKDRSVSIAPNPAKNSVNVKASGMIRSIQLFDSLGRILQVTAENKNATSLDISDKPKGIYYLKITTEDGSKVQKLVKE